MFQRRRGDLNNLQHRKRLRHEMTPSERLLWKFLRSRQIHNLKFRRQHGIGPYIVDFYCPEKATVIEIDGDTHAEANQRIKDRRKEEYLSSMNIRLIRYTNCEVLRNVDGVVEDMLENLSRDSTSPTPPYKGGAC